MKKKKSVSRSNSLIYIMTANLKADFWGGDEQIQSQQQTEGHMESKDTKSCSFLCFRNCRNEEEEDPTKRSSNPQHFSKLSLKKVKDEQLHMVRSNSYKRIDRPIPTTERSVEQGTEAYLNQLIEKKKRVERQIQNLNTDFDRYYELYASKLKELKELQIHMNQQFRDKANS